MILEDFVMLGKTTPETDRQGRVTVCSAGWSPELKQLVRVYPLSTKKAPPDFSVSQVRLERNSRDTRPESWKIQGDRDISVHENINSRFDVKSIINDWSSLLNTIPQVGSMAEANSRKLSLAIVEPDTAPKYYFDENKSWTLSGKTHKLKYLNQEAYEFMTPKSRGFFRHVANKFKSNPKLLVGNMFAYRNNWLVISAFC